MEKRVVQLKKKKNAVFNRIDSCSSTFYLPTSDVIILTVWKNKTKALSNSGLTRTKY